MELENDVLNSIARLVSAAERPSNALLKADTAMGQVFVNRQGMACGDILEYMPNPTPVASRQFESMESFVAYVARFQTDGTIITVGGNSIKAELDWHQSASTEAMPTHSATLQVPLTDDMRNILALGSCEGQKNLVRRLHDVDHCLVGGVEFESEEDYAAENPATNMTAAEVITNVAKLTAVKNVEVATIDQPQLGQFHANVKTKQEVIAAKLPALMRFQALAFESSTSPFTVTFRMSYDVTDDNQIAITLRPQSSTKNALRAEFENDVVSRLTEMLGSAYSDEIYICKYPSF